MHMNKFLIAVFAAVVSLGFVAGDAEAKRASAAAKAPACSAA
jgi:hypothetical protein